MRAPCERMDLEVSPGAAGPAGVRSCDPSRAAAGTAGGGRGRAADVAGCACIAGASQRLPEISVILYEGETEDHLIYVPVEPADPFTEAVRTAREMGAEVAFHRAGSFSEAAPG